MPVKYPDQDHLRMQGDDSFKARMKRVADFRDRFRFGWIIAVRRVADETSAAAYRKNNLGQVRRQWNDSRHASR